MRYGFIQAQQNDYPVKTLCRVMDVSSSAYYDWRKANTKLIDSKTWQLCHYMKMYFSQSRQSMGSRRMKKQLCKEGFQIGRYKIRQLMKKLGLVVKRKQRFILTTDSKHSLPVAPNLLNRQFNPAQPNQVWTTDITYIWTLQGWLYLAVVIDLYSRRVIGWNLDDRMTQPLVTRALLMAINLRNPPKGLIHHSDRGSQYASHKYQQLLEERSMVSSMSRKGNCWDNSPTERFFGSLKREWLTGNAYQTRDSAKNDIQTYIAYYNAHRIHTAIGNMSPIEFEKNLSKVSDFI